MSAQWIRNPSAAKERERSGWGMVVGGGGRREGVSRERGSVSHSLSLSHGWVCVHACAHNTVITFPVCHYLHLHERPSLLSGGVCVFVRELIELQVSLETSMCSERRD